MASVNKVILLGLNPFEIRAWFGLLGVKKRIRINSLQGVLWKNRGTWGDISSGALASGSNRSTWSAILAHERGLCEALALKLTRSLRKKS